MKIELIHKEDGRLLMLYHSDVVPREGEYVNVPGMSEDNAFFINRVQHIVGDAGLQSSVLATCKQIRP